MTVRTDTSVLITAYNYGQYLPETISSIAAQTRLPVEVIIVNDGSTDDTAEIVAVLQREYANNFPIRLITQKNSGVASALNRGFQEARTSYVAHLDADDLVSPTFVEVLTSALDRNPKAAVAYGKYRLFEGESGQGRYYDFSPGRLVFDWCYISSANVMRREAVMATRGWRSDLEAWEDYEFYLTLLQEGWTAVGVPEVVHFWRRHVGARNYQKLKVRLRLKRQLLLGHMPLVIRLLPVAPFWLTVSLLARLRYRIGITRGPHFFRAQSPWILPD